MEKESFVFVDIETNGGSSARGRIIEVAAIKVLDGEIIDTYQTLVNPGSNIPYWITNLTGITTNDLVHAPHFADIAYELFEFLQGSVFVAHNVLFDYSFLKREFAASDYQFNPKLFCTVKMSRALYPEHRGHSLQKIIERHRLTAAHRHRAYDDALAIYNYTKLAISQKGFGAFASNLALQLKTRTLPPNVDTETILNLPETTGIYIFEDNAGIPLYVGKSVNIRTRVRSHFTTATSVAKEMKMSLRSHNVSYIETPTEVEALLLESAKIKELQPVFNRKLRRKKVQHVVVKRINDAGYMYFDIEAQDLASYANLENVYGVFVSKSSAKSQLESVVRTYQLCPKLMGLEKSSGECFRRQLGLCRGACAGLEAPESYNARVEFALERLKLESWPYRSKVAVVLSAARSLIVDQWIPQGIYDHEHDAYTELPGSFDLDTYKILRSFMRNHKLKITLIDELSGPSLSGV